MSCCGSLELGANVNSRNELTRFDRRGTSSEGTIWRCQVCIGLGASESMSDGCLSGVA